MRKTIFELPTIFTVSKVLRITGLQRFEFGDEFFGLAYPLLPPSGLLPVLFRVWNHFRDMMTALPVSHWA